MKPNLRLLTAAFISFSLSLFSQNILQDSSQLKADNTPSVKTDNALQKGAALVEKVHTLKDSTASALKTVPSITKIINNPLKNLLYNLALNFDLSRGNQNYANFIPQLGLDFENNAVGFKTRMMYNFARLNGQQLNSDLIARNTLSFLPKSKMPIQLLAGGESSKIRKLPGRTQTGLGVGFNLLKKQNHRIRAGVNGVYDRSRYNGTSFINDADIKTNTRKVLGPLFQLAGHHTLSQGRVLFTYDVSTLHAMNHKNDYRFNAMSAFTFPVLKGVSLRSSLIYSYESVILQNTKHGDLFMTVGVGLGQF